MIGRDLSFENSVRVIVSTTEGREFCLEVLKLTGLQSANPNIESHATMCFNEGRRSVGAALVDAIASVDSDAYAYMLNEDIRRRQALLKQQHKEETDAATRYPSN